MKLKKSKVRELQKSYFDNNCTAFARELGIDPTHLHRFINTGCGGGMTMISAVIKFCQHKGLDYLDYIDL